MYIFGERLLEERNRLGLTQDQMAAAGSVAKRTYCNYESGERAPGADFLTGIAATGADVQYILTGLRSVPAQMAQETPPEYVTLPPRKRALMALINMLDDAGTDEIRVAAEKIKKMKDLEKENAELKGRAE